MNFLKLIPTDKKKSSVTSTNFRTQKIVTRNQTKSDQKESHVIDKEKHKVETLKSKLKVKKEKIERYKEEINRLFKKSNTKETELKKYIVGLNSKVMSLDTRSEDEVEAYYSKIVELIGQIQEKIKVEINYTKQEMEKEVLYRFMDAEQKQQNLLDEKIDEQKRIIQKMNFTRQEIEKIRILFEETNIKCDMLSKENDSLKISFQTVEDDKKSYQKKLKQVSKECKELIKDNKHLFEDDEELASMQMLNINEKGINEDISMSRSRSGDEKIKDSSDEKDSESEMENTKKIKKLKNQNDNFMGKKFSQIENIIEEKSQKENELKNKYNSNFEDIDDTKNSDHLINTLKENIKSIKREYKNLHQNYTVNISQRNEAQQLLQKCIEDVKFDIHKVNTDVSNLQKKSNLFSEKEKLNQELKMKKHHLSSLENKLKILTFVYDNGFSSNNFKQNKLLSPIFKK